MEEYSQSGFIMDLATCAMVGGGFAIPLRGGRDAEITDGLFKISCLTIGFVNINSSAVIILRPVDP